MNFIIASLLTAYSISNPVQNHDMKPAEAMKQIAFITGDWQGKQEFNTGGAPMVGDIVVSAKSVVGGRYIEEVLATTIPGRKPTDSRHMIGFDPKTGKYRAQWYNDTNNVPSQLEGSIEGNKLVFQTVAAVEGVPSKSILRATYTKVSENEMKYILEMKTPEGWTELFHNSFKK